MQNVSETVKKLYKTQNSSEVNKNYKILIDESINIENSDIVYGSFKLNQVICSPDTLTFGESNAAMIQFQCASSIGNIKGKEMDVSQDINGNIVSFGKYIIDNCEITENRRYRTIIGYDNIYKFRKDVSGWYAGLAFPITIKSMFQSLCEFFKVGYVEPNFVNGEMLVEKTIDADELLGITILKSIAELNGGFFRANPSGLIEFITLDRSTVVEEFPISAYTNLKKEDFQVKKYDRLNIRQEMGDIGVSSGTGDNAYIIEDNFLVYGKSTKQLKTVADNLYTIISDIQYVPYTATEIGLPYLEPGDYVKYITTSGNFCSFIFSRTLTGTQVLKDNIETKGTEENEETFGLEKEIIKLKGKSNVITRSIESTKEKITNLETDIKENYSTTTETLAEITKAAGEIKSTVEATYTTKEEFENLEIGATNILQNYSHYTENNKLKLVATKDNYFEITSAKVSLEKDKQYTFSCKTDGIWGTGTDDTVEAYLLLNGQYQIHFRMDSNEKFTFTAPKSGEYYLRLDVNKNGMTHYFWNFQIEEGNKVSTWSPSPHDVNAKITNISTIATQTANKFNWLVKSGTSESDFIITDRLVELTSEKLEINALTTFMNNAKKGTATVINGSSVRSGNLSSTNACYVVEVDSNLNEVYKLIKGSILNLDEGSFMSPNLSWDSYGNMTASNVNFKSGYIGNWHLNPETNTICCLKNYGGRHGTDYEIGMRAAVESSLADSFLDQWAFYSGYKNPDSEILNAWFYIKVDGTAYFNSDLYAGNLICTKFLNNWEAWNTGGLFTQKLFGSTTAGTRYCFWMEPIREEQGIETCILFGGQQDSRATDKNYWDTLWYIKITGEAKFDDVYASKYNTVSDRNKKHDIEDLDEQTCIDMICRLKAVKYKYNDTEYERYHWGFIAQEVEEMLDSIGIGWRDYAVVDKSISKKGISQTDECNDKEQREDESDTLYNYYLRYEAFIAPLVKTVQSQQRRLDAQQKEIDGLKILLKELLNKFKN